MLAALLALPLLAVSSQGQVDTINIPPPCWSGWGQEPAGGPHRGPGEAEPISGLPVQVNTTVFWAEERNKIPMGHWGQATLRPRRWGQRQWGQTTLRPDDVEARRRWGQTTLRPGDVEARYVWVTFPNLNIGLNVATLRPMFGLKVATSRPMLSQNLIENFFF